MIRHCVFIKFKSSITPVQRNTLFADVLALQSHLPGMLTFHSGENCSPELGMDKGFSDGFIIDFRSAEERDIYLHDEVHQAVGKRLVNAAAGGAEGVMVFDLAL